MRDSIGAFRISAGGFRNAIGATTGIQKMHLGIQASGAFRDSSGAFRIGIGAFRNSSGVPSHELKRCV